MAVFVLPKGRYDLTISSDGYGGPATAVTVNADAVLEIEAVKTMTAAELEANYERWELNQWG